MADVELTQAQTRELQAIEQAIIAARTNLERAQQAGLDVGDLRRALESANAKRIGMLEQFSPGAIARRQR